MEYKTLGNSGLKVSTLCLGTMTFGGEADESTSKAIYQAAKDKGINFFDTANIYNNGTSEKILGKLIHEHRDEVVIATKAYFPTGEGVNNRGLGRGHLIKALDDSLKRLNTDYIDVYYAHAFDENTPLEETLATFDNFVKQGKVRYLGLSNFAAWQVMKAIAVTQQNNYTPISVIQPMYNLVKRQCESELLPMALSEGLGVTSYSPLGGGLLTGKYKTGKKEGRFAESTMYQKRYNDEITYKTVNSYVDFANQNNLNPVSLAIAWVKAHKAITAPLIGARNLEQLKPALASLDISMTEELRAKITDLSPEMVLATGHKKNERS
ncbi:aryl-alcohol dehydrogenase-like predicted oxidoreductase [Tenacibaculum gallaicum]|uniref:Aryl-alcohol dehydrogenase-like predicted oxidoreductase n=1 Tax=Tenacibaculum gallaicum TaxID=561505 RepID=A0A3E0I8D7_9FLAO|nr:aldo/keto reductase [Tenacibaculum gallaicum]REH54871.1 aryl-alcohol dehydrogenase-like predicted oxidoreductase [Tenacibaculum gallaicum]